MLFLYTTLLDTHDEKSKFEELYNKYRYLMYHIALAILRDEHLAEDAVHSAFLRIVNHFNKLGNIYSHKTKAFVVIVVESVAKNIYKERKRQSPTLYDQVDYLIDDKAQVLDDVIDSLSLEEIVAKIKELSPIDSNILMLRYVHDISIKEIARISDTKNSTIRKRLERARGRLAKLLAENGGHSDG
ncbi:MAG TPA: sigma-70 family RNA polymerase sigma factor [Bacillota bacterium]|nr:sigma-70 family RNA polymerase sigma factor [Bacillota bacterium]